ncbi:MAG: hypothetical protein R3245_05865 [Kiloniellales bacterium]|nr:hypothetical protein [Kiloniellales bacterium]
MYYEDPAVFEALRQDLYAYFEPRGPIEETLVEQVASTCWRLRRVPEIEAGILEHYYHGRRAGRARSKQFEALDIDEEQQAKERQDRPLPALGAAFSDAERSLSSLARIAATIEGSMYRAIRELERRKAERQDPSDEFPVVDVEDDEKEPPSPRLIQP